MKVSTITQFLRDWMLVIAMLCGMCGYAAWEMLDVPHEAHVVVGDVVSVVQPALIFAMLFLVFCRMDLKRMRLCRWQFGLLAVQGGSFVLLAGASMLIPNHDIKVLLEGAMLCMICPTATAAAVVTRKLGGNMEHITGYTILINVLCSILVPVIVPLLHPEAATSMVNASLLIAGKVYPLLLLPLFMAVVVKHLLPFIHRKLVLWTDLSFYLWAVALALAIAVTARSIWHSTVGWQTQIGLVLVSLACCAIQFAVGHRLGAPTCEQTTAGQALGQKNTVLAIWMGYTFFTPVTSLVGGFYSIWHNVYNTLQLRQAQQKIDSRQSMDSD